MIAAAVSEQTVGWSRVMGWIKESWNLGEAPTEEMMISGGFGMVVRKEWTVEVLVEEPAVM